MKNIAKKYPLLFGIVAFILFYCSLKFTKNLSVMMEGIVRILAAIVMVIVTWPTLKDKYLKFPGTGWGQSFKTCRQVIIASSLVVAIPSILMLVAFLLAGDLNGVSLKTDWVVSFISTAILCLGVGVAEEIGFRRSIYASMLEQFRGKKNALMIVTIICSFFFGFVHVASSLSADPITIITAILKTTNSGMFALIVSSALLESKNIWPISIIHALTDFLPLLGTVLFGGSTNVEYVSTSTSGSDGYSLIALYFVYILICLPKCIKIIKKIKNNEYDY